MTVISTKIPLFAPPRPPDVTGYGARMRLAREDVPGGPVVRRVRASAVRTGVVLSATWQFCLPDEFDALWSFFSQRTLGGVQPFEWTPPDAVSSPRGYEPEVEQVTAGSLGARTYAISFTWYSASGESKASASASVAMLANRVARVRIPALFPPGATGFRVYFDDELQDTVDDGSLVWDEPTTGKASGQPSPTTNTLTTPRLWLLDGEPEYAADGPNTRRVSASLHELVIFATDPPILD